MMSLSSVSIAASAPPARDAPSAPQANHPVPDLYTALAAALLAADRAIVERDAEGKARGLETATAVVFELIASVDFERGGELAPRLAALYGYFSSELVYIDRNEARGQIRELLDMIGVLTGTWYDGGVVAGPF
jgi:flagellar protein FliS